MNKEKTQPQPIHQIPNINEIQQKILNICYYNPTTITQLMIKLNKNHGYLWNLCQMLRGQGLLTTEFIPPKKTYYKTNRDMVKLK